ncbi:protein kinase [Actinoplanes sp. TBRC 11911]|uniref:protein kinase family protein n=1 Tax=Actinoplanes sp. TBRC 11911 TaxID=2729386 RepID=UPI00145E5180|nr:protein kinase family protein [Actinoplanes sp. TBRC 11911]NMO54408.1 protein kinase [Actinoplanes sp. TBRC 11911]
MTQVGEGHETAADADGPVMTFGAPTVGEILAERYQLEEHVNDDSAGRQVWRGVDVILRRPVAVVLRRPGGDPAAEMLQAAVDASRVIHPNLVGVYDAIDEGARAYVVREWVDGESLRDLVTHEGPLDPARATTIAHALADALTAVHATGMVHGNVHPGTTLIADDGRVVLADARADSADDHETDVRAVGAILYYSLTGHWPHAEVGASALPDANRDGSGNPATPRQIRAGVPAYLDDLTMDLLDKRVAAPEADALAAELARLDAAAEDDYEDAGPLRFAQNTTTEPARSTPKIVVGVAALAVIAIVGLVFGIRAITSSSDPGPKATNQAGAGTTATTGKTDDPSETPVAQPKTIPLSASMVRMVDPPKGERQDSAQAKYTVDNDPNTVWQTQRFNTADFGNLKKGMGVLINLGTPRRLAEITVETSSPGVAMDIRTGPADYGDNSSGDKKIVDTYKKLGDGDTEKTDGTRQVFSVFDPNQKYQYVLVFLTELPRAEDGDRYQVSVNKIELTGF